MKSRFHNPARLIATLCALLVLALSAAWAAAYQKSKVIGASGGVISINSDAHVRIPNGALNDATEVTVEMVEVYDDNGDLSALLFMFGPAGTVFADGKDAELRLKGDYALADHVLLDENGEALEYTTQGNGNLVTFRIPHFSSYTYDHYDY